MALFGNPRECPPHDWTEWKFEKVKGFKIYGWGKNKRREDCLIRYQWRECVKCGYREEEPL